MPCFRYARLTAAPECHATPNRETFEHSGRVPRRACPEWRRRAARRQTERYPKSRVPSPESPSPQSPVFSPRVSSLTWDVTRRGWSRLPRSLQREQAWGVFVVLHHGHDMMVTTYAHKVNTALPLRAVVLECARPTPVNEPSRFSVCCEWLARLTPPAWRFGRSHLAARRRREAEL